MSIYLLLVIPKYNKISIMFLNKYLSNMGLFKFEIYKIKNW